MPAEFELPGSPSSLWLPRTAGAKIYNENYLVLMDDVVRGVFVLKHEEFALQGTVHSIVCCHHAYSEGITNKVYASIGTQIFRYCVSRFPLIYALGMQGYKQPLPRLLIKMGWSHCLLPFYIRVLNTRRFLWNIQVLRGTSGRRFVTNFAAYSGSAWLAINLLQETSKLKIQQPQSYYEVVQDFGDWADQVWQDSEGHYKFLPLRTHETLKRLYPAENSNFTRLRVRRGSRTLGWAVVGHVRRWNDPNYGTLYIGTILDSLGKPEDSTAIIQAATQGLEDRGVDLIISNQSHPSWAKALRRSGYLAVPSNYVFAVSKPLAQLLMPFPSSVSSMHMNRSCADGLFPYSFLDSDLPASGMPPADRISA